MYYFLLFLVLGALGGVITLGRRISELETDLKEIKEKQRAGK